VYGTLVHDLGNDGTREVLLGGNFSGVRPKQGRYDASYGTLLRQRGDDWTAVPPAETNLYLDGEVRALGVVRGDNGLRFVIAARNNARPQILFLPRPNRSSTSSE
jgi:hypothetical protein